MRISRLMAALALALACGSHASAQNQPTPHCPAKYELVAGYCIEATTGDVVHPVSASQDDRAQQDGRTQRDVRVQQQPR
jgi:hypothetical protein